MCGVNKHPILNWMQAVMLFCMLILPRYLRKFVCFSELWCWNNLFPQSILQVLEVVVEAVDVVEEAVGVEGEVDEEAAVEDEEVEPS